MLARMNVHYRWVLRRIRRTSRLLQQRETRRETVHYLLDHTAWLAAARLIGWSRVYAGKAPRRGLA